MTHGDDPTVHRIRQGRFVCTADKAAPCHNYPACECEIWDSETHFDNAEPGHEVRGHDECWFVPWMQALGLSDSYALQQTFCDDDDFPDGPVTFDFDFDCLLWEYADTHTQPALPIGD
jgi:hypothetical protein